jgi:hypothetical protein
MDLEEALVKSLNWLARLGTRWPLFRRAPAPVTGRVLGTATETSTGGPAVPVVLNDEEWARHCYILGSSGSGKSRLLQAFIRQEIRQGHGFAVLDPHGDLVTDLLGFLYVESRRLEKEGTPLDLARVYLVEPHREDALIGLNPLDPGAAPLHPHIGELVGAFRRLWASSWGPRLEECLRSSLITLSLSKHTLAELPALLTDEGFRARVLAGVGDETLLSYWRDRYDRLSDAGRAAVSEPVLNKATALIQDPRLRGMLGQQAGALDFRRLMDEGAWIFLNLSRGQLRDSSYLLGSFCVASFFSAALSRADLPAAARRPFTLYVDEFQHFRGEDFEALLCEARKYALSLTLAHQHLGQVESGLQNAIFGNIGSHVFFSLSPGDAGIVSRELPAGSAAVPLLLNLPVGHAMVRRRGQAPVVTRILPVEPPPVDEAELEMFAARLRARHGRPLSEVEAEIQARLRPPRSKGRTSGASGSGRSSRGRKKAGEGQEEPVAPPASLVQEAEEE